MVQRWSNYHGVVRTNVPGAQKLNHGTCYMFAYARLDVRACLQTWRGTKQYISTAHLWHFSYFNLPWCSGYQMYLGYKIYTYNSLAINKEEKNQKQFQSSIQKVKRKNWVKIAPPMVTMIIRIVTIKWLLHFEKQNIERKHPSGHTKNEMQTFVYEYACVCINRSKHFNVTISPTHSPYSQSTQHACIEPTSYQWHCKQLLAFFFSLISFFHPFSPLPFFLFRRSGLV